MTKAAAEQNASIKRSNEGGKKEMRARSPIPDLAKLSEAQQKVYTNIVEGRRGRLDGPLAIWLNSADFAHYAQQLGEFCRYRTSLSPMLSELLILIMAEQWQAGLEWAIHAPIALEVGLPRSVIDAVGRGETPDFENEEQALVHEFATMLLSRQEVTDTTYSRAIEMLGTKAVVEIVGVLGYYSLISMTIKAFKLQVPDTGSAPFP